MPRLVPPEQTLCIFKFVFLDCYSSCPLLLLLFFFHSISWELEMNIFEDHLLKDCCIFVSSLKSSNFLGIKDVLTSYTFLQTWNVTKSCLILKFLAFTDQIIKMMASTNQKGSLIVTRTTLNNNGSHICANLYPKLPTNMNMRSLSWYFPFYN